MSILHSTLGSFDRSIDMFPELGDFANMADKRAATETEQNKDAFDDIVTGPPNLEFNEPINTGSASMTEEHSNNVSNGNMATEGDTEVDTNNVVLEMNGNRVVDIEEDDSLDEIADNIQAETKRKVSKEQALLKKKNRNGMNQFQRLKTKLESFQSTLGYESDYIVLIKNNFYKKI